MRIGLLFLFSFQLGLLVSTVPVSAYKSPSASSAIQSSVHHHQKPYPPPQPIDVQPVSFQEVKEVISNDEDRISTSSLIQRIRSEIADITEEITLERDHRFVYEGEQEYEEGQEEVQKIQQYEEVDISGDERPNNYNATEDEAEGCPFLQPKQQQQQQQRRRQHNSVADEGESLDFLFSVSPSSSLSSSPSPRRSASPSKSDHVARIAKHANVNSALASSRLPSLGHGFAFPLIPASARANVEGWLVKELDALAKKLGLTGPPTSITPPAADPREPGLAANKQAKIWSNVIKNARSRPYDLPVAIAGIFTESLDPTIHWVSDQIKPARIKKVHQVGVVGKAHLELNSYAASRYTGVLGLGAEHLIIRLSSGNNPNQEQQKIVPGLAIKILRDGRPSGNIFAMREADTRGNRFNFFSVALQNHLSAIGSSTPAQIVGIKFRQVTGYAAWTGVSDVARFTEQGDLIPDNQIRAPFQLVFVPNADLKAANLQFDGYTWTDQFADIQAGTTLYDIYAQDEPHGPLSDRLGSLILDSEFTTSYYGDATLFFKHQIVEEDFIYRPDWKPQCPTDVSCEWMYQNAAAGFP